MRVIKPVGRDAAVRKYDILSALTAHALASDAQSQRLVLRLTVLITARYNWQRDELITGQKEIARMWCVDERTVKRDMARLRAMGWVVVKRQGARGRVSVLGLDLDRIMIDTRPSWTNIGEDFVQRMTGPEIPSAADNVVPFRRLDMPNQGDGLWRRVCEQLQTEDAAIFDAWFRPMIETGQAEGVLSLTAPSRFHATYLRTHLLSRLQSALRRAEPGMVAVRIESP